MGEFGFADYPRDLSARARSTRGRLGLRERGAWEGLCDRRCARDSCLGHSRFTRTACLIHPDHAASLRVAAKCGYPEERRAVYHGSLTMVLWRGL